MDKCIKVFLLFLLICVLAGCQVTKEPPTPQNTAPPIRVGYARTDISPTESVPLAGYGNTSNRMSQSVKDPIYATCLAISDGNQTALLYTVDLISLSDAFAQNLRTKIAAAVNIPATNIHIACTHTHSAPDTANSAEPSIERYNSFLLNQMTTAATTALADSKEARMYISTAHPENMNFVRSYLLSNGSYVGDNHGDYSGGAIICHATDADNLMQLVKFTREGAKDIVLANWQSHPHRFGGSPHVSADIVGVMRSYVEEELNCNFAYFTGASGNINPNSKIETENITADYMAQGQALGEYAVAAASGFTEITAGPVKVHTVTFSGKVNHTLDNLYEVAQKLISNFDKNNTHGIYSVYHAKAIVNRRNMGDTKDLVLGAITIGDLAFVTAPYEMFDANGKEIRSGSPYKMTFVLTCANGTGSYIPSAQGYEYGCYGADISYFAPGTGEELAQEFIRMLCVLYGTP